ncbi:outer membrane protein assembly factor BamD [Blochmannia endosymbiont of Colobopsis nipponica]|uniref:outer membrane protein assembly factor BamD n=1 Tax=Blochmannia endosymbiont of Colobopsis nipponica TaxID=2681987 RepID=UPI00177E58FF|nr:outer membrane protein assembly factor BamD [Blochmannia endosymbiont of Colobopsis nipponica]QOI11231.1 outer membrane protein assembly factor BamD [Blochmannia endosymbiont of Colobopsis nipponica]
MKIYIKYFFIIINVFVLILIHSNNGSLNAKVHHTNNKFHSLKSSKFIKNNNNKELTKLKKTNDECSNIECEQQAQLNLIDFYYTSDNPELTKKTINQFLYLYPYNPNLDYVFYIKGLTNLSLDKNHNYLLYKLLNINPSHHNPIYAYEALRDFTYIIEKYPDSKFRSTVNDHILFLKNRIAEYELHIVKFYNTKKAYIAVINRVNKIIDNLPDTSITYQSLNYLYIAYEQLGLTEIANKIKQQIIIAKES